MPLGRADVSLVMFKGHAQSVGEQIEIDCGRKAMLSRLTLVRGKPARSVAPGCCNERERVVIGRQTACVQANPLLIPKKPSG